MKLFKILTIATLLPIFTPQKLSAEFTLLSSIVLGMGGSIFKTETLKKEAIIHLAEGEIIEPTELMKSFLKEASH
jgi:hypothetical protein